MLWLRAASFQDVLPFHLKDQGRMWALTDLSFFRDVSIPYRLELFSSHFKFCNVRIKVDCHHSSNINNSLAYIICFSPRISTKGQRHADWTLEITRIWLAGLWMTDPLPRNFIELFTSLPLGINLPFHKSICRRKFLLLAQGSWMLLYCPIAVSLRVTTKLLRAVELALDLWPLIFT